MNENQQMNISSLASARRGVTFPTLYVILCFGSANLWRSCFHCFLSVFFQCQHKFLDASSHLYKRVCPSVRPFVPPSIPPSLRLSVGNAFLKIVIYLSETHLLVNYWPCWMLSLGPTKIKALVWNITWTNERVKKCTYQISSLPVIWKSVTTLQNNDFSYFLGRSTGLCKVSIETISRYRLPDVTTTHKCAKALHEVVTEFNVLRIA